MAHILLRGILLASMMIAVAAMAGDVPGGKKELAPTGSLRVGVVAAPKANVFFVAIDADGKPRGVTVDLGDVLARTLDVASEFIVAHNSGELTDALERGLIDVAFLPVDEERKKRVAFGPVYVQFESTCLVLGSSGFKTVSDLDRQGVRVAVERRGFKFGLGRQPIDESQVIDNTELAHVIDSLLASAGNIQ